MLSNLDSTLPSERDRLALAFGRLGHGCRDLRLGRYVDEDAGAVTNATRAISALASHA